MAESNFVDYVKICCRSGKGGGGSRHFRREKFIERGGPDGGDGGRGGHIIVRGSKDVWTLLHLKYRKHVIAEDGEAGAGAKRTGAQGEDEILKVPLGTVAKDFETGRIEFEITEEDQEYVLVSGGRGGLGNDHFKTSTNQAPDYAQPGEPGKEEWKILELKVLADVGLVGFPNAGKSTLLSVVSAAKPEIADYPFTTLVPNLGMVRYRGDRSFVMADIPGIIEGAAEGKGLGHRFLRHIERNSTLLFMIACDSKDIAAEYKVLVNELGKYNPELLHKKRLLAITKSDMLDEIMMDQMRDLLPKDVPSMFISAVANMNIDRLNDMIWEQINS